MNFLKKLSLIAVGIVFCLGLYVTTSNAQTNRNRSWNNRSYNSQRQWRNNRQGRITPQESRRLQRERSRIYQTRNRFYRNDGRISWSERQRLANRYRHYRRDVRRDRRDY